MCGIVGVVYGPNGSKAEKLTPSKAAISMFPNVEHRGKDAFGWMHRKPDGNIQLRKFAQNASSGLENLEPSHRFGIPDDAEWWIGHVRLATHGSPSFTHNNHPIVHGDILGVHNGICYNYGTVLNETGRQHKKAEVDSEAIFAAIDHFGIFKGLDKVDALAALVFVDRTNPDVVHLATCDANPLIIGRTKTGATYFASESWILEELGLEWDEDGLWMMGDFTYMKIVDGVQGDYVQWADPKKKSFSGYKSYSSYGYGSYHGGYTGPASEVVYDSRERYNEWGYDEVNDEWYDPTTGRMGSGPLAAGSVLGPDEVECLSCNWDGPEYECESGECPQCGSFAYLVPRGVVSDGTKSAVQMEIDASLTNGEEPGEWVQDYLKQYRLSRVTTDDDVLVVGGDGKVHAIKRDKDTLATVDRILGRS